MKKQKQPDINSYPVVIDVSEAAKLLNVDVEKVYELVDQGVLKNCPDTWNRTRITKTSLKQYLLKEIIKRVK